jgi:hypothetical protein
MELGLPSSGLRLELGFPWLWLWLTYVNSFSRSLAQATGGGRSRRCMVEPGGSNVEISHTD